MNFEKNLKIKTKGLTSLLRSMNYNTSVVVIKTALLDPVLIKQYLSVQRQMNRITNTINEVKI